MTGIKKKMRRHLIFTVIYGISAVACFIGTVCAIMALANGKGFWAGLAVFFFTIFGWQSAAKADQEDDRAQLCESIMRGGYGD